MILLRGNVTAFFGKGSRRVSQVSQLNWKENPRFCPLLFGKHLTKRGKLENKKRFKELLNRYPAEPEHKYPLTEDGKYDLRNMEIIDDFYDNVKYTDEEIEFMAEQVV